MKKSIPNKIITILFAAVLVVAFVTAGISVAVKKAESKKRTLEVGKVVLKIGETEISRDEFVFSCVATIESELSEIARSGIVESELNELIKEKTTKNIEEYVAMTEAAKKAGTELTDTEKIVIEKDAEKAGDEKFFRENYNISRAKYVEIKENWKICEKFLENIKNADNIPQEEIDKICNDNYTRLFTASVNAIYFDTTTIDDGASGLNKIEAENVYNQLLADRTLFETLYEEYNDAGLSTGDVKMTVDEKTFKNFPEVFEAVYKGNEGDFLKLETEKGIAIIEILEKGNVHNNEKIIEIYAENKIKEIIEKGNKAVKTDVYKKVDVTKYIDERSKIN